MANEKACPVCNNHAHYMFTKLGNDYYQCSSCNILFCEPIDQDGMVGGEHEEGRNESQNHLRKARIEDMIVPAKKDDIHILDFGCGHGLFLKDLKAAGFKNVSGYDAYHPEFCLLPERNKYHVAVMTEVIEHISYPFVELDVINRSLIMGGIVMVETSFVDIAAEENISLEDFFYVAPQNGHCTIHSHHSLDVLMTMKGFVPVQHIDRNVRNYKKVRS
jgi:2-polyprenyl-3-methyl-5-hydroxy-6-metoxy-1,4-benzoquinol methylase